MVNLLKNQTIRLISAILSFFAISSIVAHSFVFIILYANTQEEPLETIPFSLIGQGLWCGGTAIVSSATLFAFVNAREKVKSFFNVCCKNYGILVKIFGIFF